MAGSSSRNSKTLAAPPTSATVFDFACLFTHDLKRKQKRWQDGALKYHTFNKRIMVYDDRGHFIGDAHWQAETGLEEGDEFELDRGSAIVQVSDCTGHREQDLTGLLDKRAQDVEKRRANASSRTPMPSAGSTTPVRQDQSAHFQLRHRPLSAMLGTPSRIGRAAIPLHSPFEARRMAQRIERAEQAEPAEQANDSRPSKRRKAEVSPISKPSHARSLFGQTLTLSARPVGTPVVRGPAMRDRTNVEARIQLTGSKAMPISLTATSSGLPEESCPSSIEAGNPSKTVERGHSHQPPSVAKLKSTKLPRVPAITPVRRGQEESHSFRPGTGSLADREGRILPSEDPVQVVPPHIARSRQIPPSPKLGSCGDATPILEDRHDVDEVQRKKKKTGPVLGASAMKPRVKHDAEHSVANEEPSGQNTEPRTKLRIKPRQRRGLLMISENTNRNQQVAIGPSTQESAEPEADQELCGPQHAYRQPQRISAVTKPESKHHVPLPLDEPSSMDVTDTTAAIITDHVTHNDTTLTSRKMDEESVGKVYVIMDSDNDHLEDNGASIIDGALVSEEAPKRSMNIVNGDDNQPAGYHDDTRNDDNKVLQNPTEETTSDVDIIMESDSGPMNDDAATADACKDASPRHVQSSLGKTRLRKRTRLVLSDDSESSASESLSPPQMARYPRRAEKRAENKASNAAPRITKMARKSVKSREIIGFMIPNDDHVCLAPIPSATGSARQARDRPVSVTDAEHELHKEERQDAPVRPTDVAKAKIQRANTDTVDRSEMRPAPKLSNPATRGKKAAKSEDAAGQPPQSIVQLDPVAPLHRAVAKVQVLNNETPLPLPGFAKANGGVWSRHAEDLLGMKRPAGKLVRRR